jgi:hypothetical protein
MAVFAIPVADYPVGQQALGPFSINAGLSNIQIALSREFWTDPAVKVHARFELSLDGGVTWSPDPTGEATWTWGKFPCTFDAQGGVITRPPVLGGGVVTHTTLRTPVVEPENAGRMIQGVVTVSGGTLRTEITVTTS